MKMFQVKDALSETDTRRALWLIIVDGLVAQAMVTLTTGVFLVALALHLGASNFVIGLLAGIVPIMQLLQIPAIFLVERARNRRAVATLASLFSRAFLLVIAFIPFLLSGQAALTLLLGTVTLKAALSAVANCSWNSWMRDVIPQSILGNFYSKRIRLATVATVTFSIAAGAFVDAWTKHYPDMQIHAYSLLFFAGFLAGMAGVCLLALTPEPRMTPAQGSFVSRLVKPFQDANFRRLLFFLGSWSFAANLAAPFFTVYMLQQLDLPMSLIIGLGVLSQTVNFSLLQFWGSFSDKFSNKAVLSFCVPLFFICVFAWTFTKLPTKHFLTMPMLIAIHIALGVATAGTTLSTGNIGMKLAPRGEATSYLAAGAMVNNLAAGLAPIFGGQFADSFAFRELSMTLRWQSPGTLMEIQTLNFQYWDFFFVLAFLIGLCSLYFLARVREAGDVEEGIGLDGLIAEIRRSLRPFSTVGGLRQMLHFPFGALRHPPRRGQGPA